MSTSYPETSSSRAALVSVAARTQAQAAQNGSGQVANPSTPLRPVVSTSGFTFPAIWSFPPFFTLQPNPATLAHQLNLWSELVLSWARYERVWTVNCDGVDGGGAVFWNRSILRRLLPATLKQLMAHMAKEGHTIADPPKQTSTYLLYWRKPADWGQAIYDWVTDTGQTGSILTFYELTEGDLAETTEFRGLYPAILRKAIEGLVKKGKAQVIKGEDGTGDGVRFL